MIDAFLSFLGHGGFKFVVVAFFLLFQLAKARVRNAKKREAEVRGPSTLSEHHTSQNAPTPLGAQKPIAASPWSNLDAFDGKKS